ncbi:hypothetical protein GCM10010403_30390 [Glycomyces rutgersensis]|uniref:Uncharacterized protein n=1 Tax=Glycomyces rutgersensis TaxID=58115 RepID=A0ABN3FRW4_9ACTN
MISPAAVSSTAAFVKNVLPSVIGLSQRVTAAQLAARLVPAVNVLRGGADTPTGLGPVLQRSGRTTAYECL